MQNDKYFFRELEENGKIIIFKNKWSYHNKYINIMIIKNVKKEL